MNYRRLIKYAPFAIITFIVLVLCASTEYNQQFVYLADAFLNGHLTISNLSGGSETGWAFFEGRYFWANGPLPALLLIPFVFLFNTFNSFFYQGYLQAILILLTGWVLFKLSKKLGYNTDDSLFLSFGFIFGSVFLAVAIVSSSWFLAQIITTLLIFYALYEYFSKKRWWLLGICCGLILMTRISALPIVLFFMLEAKYIIPKKRQLASTLFKLLSPIVFAGILMMIYNYIRFHSFTEQGYNYQQLGDDLTVARSYGLFSLIHVPSNIYYSLISVPLPVFRDSISHTLKFPYIEFNPWGMSIFVTSPYLLWLFSLKKPDIDRRTRNLLISVAVSAVMVFTYYGNGYYQFGYRYALDFLPMLFVVFMIKYRKKRKQLSPKMKYILLGSGVVNMFLVSTFVTKFIRI